MRKFIVPIVILIIVTSVAIFLTMPKKGQCSGYCWDTGKQCDFNVDCFGDCYCAKNPGDLSGVCAPMPGDR